MDLQKARDGSLIAKYLAIAVLLLGGVAIGLGWLKLSTRDLLTIAGGILIVVSPIDLNLVVEKLTGWRREAEPGK